MLIYLKVIIIKNTYFNGKLKKKKEKKKESICRLHFTTFHPSLLPIMLPHPFKLDNVKRPFTICIEEKVEKCKEMI